MIIKQGEEDGEARTGRGTTNRRSRLNLQYVVLTLGSLSRQDF